MRGFTLVEYDIPRGCLASYFPETNALVPLDSVAERAGTPTSKSIPVRLGPERAGHGGRLMAARCRQPMRQGRCARSRRLRIDRGERARPSATR